MKKALRVLKNTAIGFEGFLEILSMLLPFLFFFLVFLLIIKGHENAEKINEKRREKLINAIKQKKPLICRDNNEEKVIVRNPKLVTSEEGKFIYDEKTGKLFDISTCFEIKEISGHKGGRKNV